MSYSDTLEKALLVVKQQSLLMQRCLNDKKLMDALKHASAMLQELRTPNLAPKQYYEFYILVFDALSNLSLYLVENHPKHHHLADLYELVQYAGNVLPRLYLMITVGTSYLQCADVPTEEVLKDMIEMCRGVQAPIRGLFLRYYLSQRTKDLLPVGAIQFNSNFILTNFIEMNKLWVRLQHQGPLREKDKRTKERLELQILIGSQLVRLSQIIDTDLDTYKSKILPMLLEQIVLFNDVVAQEYLLDVIYQVFPQEFHLATLDMVLDTMLRLNADVSIEKMVSNLINRLIECMDKQDDESSSKQETHEDILRSFGKFLIKLNEERPHMPLPQFIPLIHSVMCLLLRWDANDLQQLNELYKIAVQKCKDYMEDSSTSHAQEQHFDQLLLLSTNKLSNKNILYDIIIHCDAYTELLDLQSDYLKLNVSSHILDILLNDTKFIIEDKPHLTKLLNVFIPILKLSKIIPPPPLRRRPTGSKNIDSAETTKEVDINPQEIQEKLAKFGHTVLSSLKNPAPDQDPLEQKIEILLLLRNWYFKSGAYISYTYPTIITNFWSLAGKIHRLKVTKYAENEELVKRIDNSTKQIFKYVSRCISDILNACGDSSLDMVFKLNIETAKIADSLLLSEITYDFVSQAFTIYEESTNDPKLQYPSLLYLIQFCQQSQSLFEDDSYFESFRVRCTIHASKLLKKQEQCRALYACSHLWWPNLTKQNKDVIEKHRQDKRVLECLQRALRVADSIMDNAQSCQLMVEILNKCLYYSSQEDVTFITRNYTNKLIELINGNIKSLELEDKIVQEENEEGSESSKDTEKYALSVDGQVIQIRENENMSKSNSESLPDINKLIVNYFQRTCTYRNNENTEANVEVTA